MWQSLIPKWSLRDDFVIILCLKRFVTIEITSQNKLNLKRIIFGKIYQCKNMFTFAPLTLKTGVALTDNAAVMSPVNNEIKTIPSRIQMIQKARAYGDFGERSPYLRFETVNIFINKEIKKE